MFFDAVGVIARTDVGISELGDLSFTTICVIENSREQALFDAAAVAGRVQYQSFFFAMGDGETMYATYNRGHCDAIVDERVRLAQRLPNFSTPHEQAFINLTLLIGPHGVFTSARDANWTEIVRSVNSAIIQAEMLGLTSFNLENALSSEDIAMRQLLGLEGDAAARLGLSSDFVVRVISHVGNYAEIYERHFGSDLPRGPNALLEDGGMISTP